MDRDDNPTAATLLSIDSRTNSVIYRGVPVDLTPAEFRILLLLSSHPEWVFPPSEIADDCLDFGGSADSIIVHISNLRAKLSRAAAGPSPIETARGFGYRMAGDPSQAVSPNTPADSSETLGDNLSASGRLAEAAAAYQGALDATLADEDLALARLHIKAAQMAIDRRLLMQALGHNLDAERILRAGDAVARSEQLDDVLVQRAWIKCEMGDLKEAYDDSAEMLRRLGDSGTPRQRMRLHGCMVRCLLAMRRYVVTPEAMAHAQQAYDAWADSGDPVDAVFTESLLGATLLWSGNIAGGEQRLTNGLRMSEELGEQTLRPYMLINLGVAARWRGEVRLAEGLGSRLRSETDERQLPELDGAAHGLLCWVAWRDGDIAKAAEEGQAALRNVALVPTFPHWWLALAPLTAVALSQSQLGDAVGYARHMLDPSQQLLPLSLTKTLSAACSAWDAGDDDSARDALASAVQVGRAGGYM